MVLPLDNIYLSNTNTAYNPALGFPPGFELQAHTFAKPPFSVTGKGEKQIKAVCFFPLLQVHAGANYTIS